MKRIAWGLVAALALHIGLALWFGPTRAWSDDEAYAAVARHMLAHEWKPSPHPYSCRLGVTVPTAFFLHCFGKQPWAQVAWPLTCSLLTIVLCWAIGKELGGARAGACAAIILATSPLQLRYGTALYPEAVCSAFMLGAAWCLAKRHDYEHWPVLAALCWWGAFLAKASAVWILPLFAVLLVVDLCVCRGLERYENRRFIWYPLLAVAGALALAYWCAYWLATGDGLYRLGGFEGHSQIENYSYIGRGGWEMARRLTYGPVVDVLFHKPYALLCLLALPGIAIVHKRRDSRSRASCGQFWLGYLACILAGFWFCSTSLQHYNPLHPAVRFLVPAVAPLSVFAGVAAAHWRRVLPFLLAGLLAVAILAGHVGYYGEGFAEFAGRVPKSEFALGGTP